MDRRSALSDLLSRLVAHMLPVTYFLVTVSFYLKTYDSAQIKITLAQIGCSLTAALWIAQLVLERRWPFQKKDLPMAAPFIAVAASGLLSWGQSSFPAGSFDEGLRRILYAFMGFIVLADFRGVDRRRRLMRWLTAAFTVVVFYGFIQYLDTRMFPPGPPGTGLDPFVWRQAFSARVFSSFGNPNFYGNFLVIITPILLVTFLKDGGQAFRPYVFLPVLTGIVILADKLWLGSFGGVGGGDRLAWELLLAALALTAGALVFLKTPTGAASGMLLFFGAMFVTLYATETKGAWVGFVGAMVFTSILAGLFLAGEGGRRFTRRLLAAAAVTAVLGAAVVGYYAKQRIQSVSFRVFTWISTWEMIREQPILGSGIGVFKWVYPAYRRPEIILLEAKSNTETDHAEDEYLEIWSDEGLLGMGLFLWLVLTVSWAGLQTLRRLTAGRGPPDPSERERMYSLAAVLGSWWAALLHWSMDVSVRFVSSGIYSLLLPSLVAGLSKPDISRWRQDAPSPLDAGARLAVALFWTAVFLSLPRYYAAQPFLAQVFPAVLMGGLLWLLSELLEKRLVPEAPEEAAPPPVGPRPPVLRLAAAAAVLGAWAAVFPVFRGFFTADLHHNIAIFFSKSGVWSKGPDFDAAAAQLPPDMRQEYAAIGGALEHYQEVTRLNPYFPMARYFIGNVYNDWGSVWFARWQQARAQGTADADGLLKTTRESWDKAEQAYGLLKAFAPNYVQTHHQMGTLELKRMQLESALGNQDEARLRADAALRNLDLYRKLDPVFPQNHYRIAQVQLFRGDLDKVEEAYRGALTYNTGNVVNRIYHDRNAESYVLLGRLLLSRLEKEGTFRPGQPRFDEAVKAFTGAIGSYEALGSPAGLRQQALDANKGLGLLYLRAGDNARASLHWSRVAALSPDDPDLKAVTGRR